MILILRLKSSLQECNLFLPQSIITQVELELLASVKRNIISPRLSVPIVQHVQDSVAGSYLMSIRDKPIDRNQATNLILYTSVGEDMINKMTKENYTGKDIFNMIIPENIKHPNKSINKSELRNVEHNIWDVFGEKETAEFVNDVQRLVLYYLYNTGFTVGLKDCMLKKETLLDIKTIIAQHKLEVDHLITEIENDPILIESEMVENIIVNKLSALVTTISDKAMKSLDDSNNLFLMINSKAKGSAINMSKITCNVGLNVVEFERIKRKVMNRSLPHFHQFDDSAISRGFVENSYLEGIQPYEFFFNAMAGRQGIIDTVVKTAETGYISRKFIKALEDVMVKYDGTLRSANNVLVQMTFGGNHCDQTKQIMHKINIVHYDNKKMKEMYYLAEDKNHFDDMLELRDLMRTIQQKAMYNYIILEDTFFLPINLQRIIKSQEKSHSSSKVTIKHVHDGIKQILKESNLLNAKDSTKARDEELFKTLYTIAIYEYLSPKRCIDEYKLSKEAFDNIKTEIIDKFNNSLMEPGEMIGIVSAQSLGEPSTQMSLVRDTKMFVIIQDPESGDTQVYTDDFGKLVDTIIKETKTEAINKSYETNVTNIKNKYYVASVNKNEKVKWNLISHVSKHPCNGGLVKITTKSGRSVCGTLSHSFLTKDEFKIVPIRGDQLKVGDYIPIVKNIPELNLLSNITEDLCYLIGLFIKDGSINDDELTLNGNIDRLYKIFKDTYKLKIKVLNNQVKVISSKLCKYFIRFTDQIPDFLFLIDKKLIKVFLNEMITSTHNLFKTELIAQQISILLNYFNIYNHVENKTVKLDKYNYGVFINKVTDDNTEIVPKCSFLLQEISKQIGIEFDIKDNLTKIELKKYLDIVENKLRHKKTNYLMKSLHNILSENIYSDVYWDEIVSLETLPDNNDYVYDFTVPDNETFMCLNGMLVHNTLNTFHSTGSASVGMQGVPRIRELISCTKAIKTPMMIIYLDDSVNKDKIKVNNIASHIKYTLFKEIIKKTEIVYNTDGYEHIKNPITLDGNKIDEKKLPWVIKIILDKNQMMLNELNMIYIKTKFINYWNYVINNLKGIKTDEKDIINNVINLMILSNYDNDSKPEIHVRIELSDYNFNKILALHDLIINNFVLMGIKNVEKISKINNEQIITFNDAGEVVREDQHIIFTNGVNLLDLRYYKNIDLNKTITNDIIEIYNVFGIEGARTALIKEIYNVFKSGGNAVNYHHIELLVDVMCNTGYLTSIDRHGINRLDTDPLSRASFEKTIDQLINAAFFGEVDHMRSVSSRIITGQPIKGGTGLPELIIDHDMIENSELSFNDIDREIVVQENPIIEDLDQEPDIDFFMP